MAVDSGATETVINEDMLRSVATTDGEGMSGRNEVSNDIGDTDTESRGEKVHIIGRGRRDEEDDSPSM